MRRIGNFDQVIVALLTDQIFIVSHYTEVLNASNGGEISASCLDLLIIKIQTARRKLTTVINNYDAPIRKPLRLLHQKLGRARIRVPESPGISAEHLDFSRDGTWVVYVTYPEGSLWRCKVDGSQRLQLTYPPMRASLPRWSPDGKQIVFTAGGAGKPWKI